MAKKNRVPLPRPDARREYPSEQQQQADIISAKQTQDAMDVRDHPAYNKPDATDHHDRTIRSFGELYNAMGPKATYSAETNQMNNAVGVSEAVPGRFEE